MITCEGRHFDSTLEAFTFAQIQADRMSRPVEVQVGGQWHCTAHPPNYVRRHMVKQPPAVIPAVA